MTSKKADDILNTSVECMLNWRMGGNMKPNEITHDCTATVIHEEVVARVREAMINDKYFYNLANLFKMFADNTRLKILWALTKENMCVCDLAALLGMTKSAISHQLKSLRLANIVKYTRQGKVVYYSLVDCYAKGIFIKGFGHILE